MNIIKIIIGVVVYTTSLNIAFSQAQTVEAKQDSIVTETFKIKGISCANDIKTICLNVEKSLGVKSCKNGRPGAVTVFTVSYNSYITSRKNIIGIIEDTPCCKDPDERPYKVKQ